LTGSSLIEAILTTKGMSSAIDAMRVPNAIESGEHQFFSGGSRDIATREAFQYRPKSAHG